MTIDYENHSYIRGTCAHVEQKEINGKEKTFQIYTVFIKTQKEYKGQITPKYTRIKFIKNGQVQALEQLKGKAVYITYDVYSKQIQGKDGEKHWMDEVVGRTYEIKEEPQQQQMTLEFSQPAQQISPNLSMPTQSMSGYGTSVPQPMDDSDIPF